MDTTLNDQRWTQHDVLYREVLGRFEREGRKVPFPIAKLVLVDLVDKLYETIQSMLDLASCGREHHADTLVFAGRF
jgi:hypothetical protein